MIEIAAVRFDAERVHAEWSTLVNPRAPLPYAVELLTGIEESALAAAPPLEAVASRLRELIGSDPLVGQSVDIDLAHLAREGLALSNPLLDTFELASFLLPGLASYDLPSVAGALGVIPSGRHRALADAHCAREVFLALVRRLQAVDAEVLKHVNRLTARFPWAFRALFLEAEARCTGGLGVGGWGSGDAEDPSDRQLQKLIPTPEPKGEIPVPGEQLKRLDVDALVGALSQGGSIAGVLSGYDERQEQLAMLRAVGEAFNRERHLLVEAGTGTGKSLAYLLPALAFASANSRRVVISTNTINLQDQLYQKDVPDLLRAMGYGVRATVLKGRSNYLCLRRWLALLRSPVLSRDEATLLVKTLLWIDQTRTGDRSELRLTPDEEIAWSRVCSEPEFCTPLTCSYHRDGSCFVARARRAAEESTVVIVNHALLLSDLASGSHVIPEYAHLIVDEAHHLEDEATAQLGYTLSVRSFLQPLEILVGTGFGAVDVAFAALHGGGIPESRLQELGGAVTMVKMDSADAFRQVDSLFTAVHELLRSRTSPLDSSSLLRLTHSVRHDGMWSAVEQGWDELRGNLGRISRSLGPLVEELSDAATAGSLAAGEILGDLTGATRTLETVIDRGDGLIADPSADAVCWVTDPSLGPRWESAPAMPAARGWSPGPPTLHLAPLEVGAYLRNRLFDARATAVLTSATLATDGSFDYVRDRLGVDGARELSLGSPFDYRRAALLFLPSDLPEPNEPGYSRRAAEAVADVAEALGGRTMALFTSYSQLRATHDMIRARMEGARIALMSQGIDGSRTRLLQRFRTTERALLLGTASFWEGVDVVGEALSALVIARLPFAVPTDPVFAARSEQFTDPFRQYAVPRAILRFKQGFGRLIRSPTDRGIIVVLDSRVLRKTYGAAFLNSVPACTVRTAPVATVGAVAREWLGRAPSPLAGEGWGGG